jgi:hypothetical protein
MDEDGEVGWISLMAIACPRCGEAVMEVVYETPPSVRVDDGVSIRLVREGKAVTLRPCGHRFTSPDLGPALRELHDDSHQLVELAERFMEDF